MAKRSLTEHRETAGLELGRTQPTTVQISGRDGETFLATVYTCINVAENPELRELLLGGKLNEVADPGAAGKSYRLAIPVVYHDPGREIFALAIPEALRHREFYCRQELLRQLEQSTEALPEYVRRFEVVFEPEQVLKLEKRDVATSKGEREQLLMRIEELEGREAQLREQWQASSAISNPGTDAADRMGLEQRASELERQAEAIEIDRRQLEEVARRVEGDRARLEEIRAALQEERAEIQAIRDELEAGRRKLQVMELNLEQQKLQLQQQGLSADDVVEEKTQVVTEDQFIEIVESDELSEADAESGAYDGVLAQRFSELPSARGTTFCAVIDDQVALGFVVDDANMARLQSGRLEVVFQLHRVGDVPVIALTLLSLDKEDRLLYAAAAPIVDRDAREHELLNLLAAEREVEIGLYGVDGRREVAWRADVIGIGNLGWARQQIRDWQGVADDEASPAAEAALARFLDGEVLLWGSMRHPFHDQSFTDLNSASDVQLAVGILEYWSQPEQVDYLIGSRAFSVQIFIEIQKRVVRQALHWGIAPGEELSELAISEAIIPDRASLTQRLLANFAEVCVGIRPNDLDPLERWENWEALIQLAERTGVKPDADVVELAEVSLKQAREFEETLEAEEGSGSGVNRSGSPAAEDLRVVSRYSEATGVTYYLPEDFLLDQAARGTFDDLARLERAQLNGLLNDENARLEAAQILVERYSAEALLEVLESTSKMSDAEVAALARFVEARADGLEAVLTQSLQDSGPAAIFVAARALASIGSTGALPRLLDAVRDPKRRGPDGQLAHCLAQFGDKLVPPLSKALDHNPEDRDLLAVLAALEAVRAGTLDELADDRSETVRRAVQKAREFHPV